ncbi:MAG: ChbG/HpnK family deacetylase [Rhodospirillaceae bacterium]
MNQPFILCADDYALSPGVSRAILDLIARGRISATGCMTVSPFWADHAAWLKPFTGCADIGLHLTLTDHRPLGPMPSLAPSGRLPPLGRLMALALARRLDPDEINAEVARQIGVFIAVHGAPPDFIDGHQHVHLLPVVRDAVVAALPALPGTWLRNCHEPPAAVIKRGVSTFKALVIGELGRPLNKLIESRRLLSNGGFSGIYDLSGRRPYAELMSGFLESSAPIVQAKPHLVMCHPGFVDEALRRIDPVTDRRRDEYDFLAGDDFGQMLARLGLVPRRFKKSSDKPVKAPPISASASRSIRPAPAG